MLKSTFCCFGRTCFSNLHPKFFTRTFLSSARPVSARSRLQLKEVPQEKNQSPADDFDKSTPRIRRFRRSRRNNLAALESAILSSEDQALAQPHDIISSDRARRHVYPHGAYEGLIRSLMRRSRMSDAVKVYEQMIGEGLMVSLSLEAQILAIAVSQAENQSKNNLVFRLKSIVQKDAFSPDDLFEVLGRMSDLNLPPEMLLNTMNVFNKSHNFTKPPNLKFRDLRNLANAAVEDGDILVALDALSALPQVGVDGVLLSDVYASFIAAIRKSAYPSRDAVSTALGQMEKQGIPPSLSVWNSLIAFEVRANSLHRPFAIYDVLKSRSEFLPDDNTFASLFKALNRFYNPKRRKFRHGRLLPDNIPSPRELYREMLGYLVRHPQDSQFHLTTSFLNTVLRSFVFSKDYAGAFLVLRLFHSQCIPVNVKTYFIVFRHLMNRVTYGIRAARKMGSVTWADHFLSLPFPVHDPTFLNSLQLSNPLASHILEICKCPSFVLDGPLYISSHSRKKIGPAKYQTPTVEEMLGKVAASLDRGFDCVPLERLVKKALLAEMGLAQELPPGQATSSALSKIIASVRQEIVPPGLQKRREKMREELRAIRLIQLTRIVTWGRVN